MTGTTTSGDTTYVKIVATYTDGSTYTSSGVYKITVTNTSPTLSVSIPDQTTTVDDAFSFGKIIKIYTLGFTSSVFSDSDGDTLTYSAMQSSGDPLPTWLYFDSTNKLFSGTPQEAAICKLDINNISLSEHYR